MKRIKLNIEIDLEGKDALAFIKKLEQLSDAITGSATVSSKPKATSSPIKKKVVSASKPSLTPPKEKDSVSNTDFISVWEQSTNRRDVANALGITLTAASMRATKLRKAGVTLKKFRGGRPKGS